jgi:hypothetical protein
MRFANQTSKSWSIYWSILDDSLADVILDKRAVPVMKSNRSEISCDHFHRSNRWYLISVIPCEWQSIYCFFPHQCYSPSQPWGMGSTTLLSDESFFTSSEFHFRLSIDFVASFTVHQSRRGHAIKWVMSFLPGMWKVLWLIGMWITQSVLNGKSASVLPVPIVISIPVLSLASILIRKDRRVPHLGDPEIIRFHDCQATETVFHRMKSMKLLIGTDVKPQIWDLRSS